LISLEHGLDIDHDNVERYKQVISPRSRRKMAKKAKTSGDTQSDEYTNSAIDLSQINAFISDTQPSHIYLLNSQYRQVQ